MRMGTNHAFLTDRRREVMTDYNPGSSTHRALKSRTVKGAKAALGELIWLAHSPVIDHTEVYPPEKIQELLTTLLAGNIGAVMEHGIDQNGEAWRPTPDQRNAWYAAIERAQMSVEQRVDSSALYEILGEKAATARDTPDHRPVHDVSAIEKCNRCELSPAPIILTDRDETKGWECYECGYDANE